MREIKFRAWDKIHKRMRLITAIDFEIGIVTFHGRDMADLNDGSVALMQYTGLKDKNGREIYEGDLLRRGDSVGEVYWQDATCRFVIDSADGGRQPDKALPLGQFPSRLYEVRGNKFENPDLLKEKP